MPAGLPQHVDNAILAGLTGSVVEMVGLTAAVADFPAPVGALVRIARQSGDQVEAEVVGFREQLTLVMPLSNLAGVRRGSRVTLVRTRRSLKVGDALLGRVVDARGRAIDGRPQPMLRDARPLEGEPIPPTDRPRIDQSLATGVKAIDGLLTVGRGQRLGIFAGSGVGKSVLMGTMCRHTDADVAVVALIGERGREVNEFIDRDLGPAGLARSVVVTATSNEPALQRVQAAQTATTIAEYFRDKGKNVLLVMDSVTRFALAQREIGLAAGEPPATRGFPPSAFAMLPKLVERAGRTPDGSITAFYSVLVEGDDENEPVADALRGLLDGHVWLSRKLAQRGHYPAIDILASISRLMPDLASPERLEAVRTVRQMLAVYADNEDLIAVGAYRKGVNPHLDGAVEMHDEINEFLRQTTDQCLPAEAVEQAVVDLAARCRVKCGTASPGDAPAPDGTTPPVAA